MKCFVHQGDFLQNARIKKGLTQKELCTSLNLHPQYVSNWERGMCAVPSHKVQMVISKLEIDKKELVEAMLLDELEVIRQKVYPKNKAVKKTNRLKEIA